MFRIDFSILDFADPEKKKYRYFLEGYDRDWIDAGNLESATYTNLDPGLYTFRVRGIDGDGFPAANEASIRIRITPPWWKTWWFRTLVIIGFGSFFYGLYRFRLYQAMKVIKLRDRIALDLHDEIGSTLNSIAFFGEVAKRLIPEENQAHDILSKINVNTMEIMDSMSDIVWSLNTRNDPFNKILDRIQSFAIQLLEPKGCEVQFEGPDDLGSLKLSMEARKNLYLLAKEAINNAAKYAGCTRLWIRVFISESKLHLEVRDNGKGFNLAKVRQGNGLHNMEKRAENLGAEIRIESEEGVGTRIEVELQVKR
jgi:signal transduction histidine kinase